MDHLVFVGLMGSGKTSVGRLVADQLGRDFFDSDAQVEARTGRTVREIFAADGEPAFRVLETQVLDEALRRSEPAVVAAAGGVVLEPANRRLLRERATVVWLRVDPAVSAARVRPGDHRPLLDTDPRRMLEQMDRERGPLYGEVADHVVDVGPCSASQVAEAVLTLVGDQSRPVR